MVVAENHQTVLRMAQCVERRYEQLRQLPLAEVTISPERWHEIGRSRQLLTVAVQHGQAIVAEEYRDRLQSGLQNLAGELTAAAHAIGRQARRSAAPTLRLLYEELAGLGDEYADIRFDLRQQQIAVRTERIVLEDFDLGPFEIRLRLPDLGKPTPYEVIALEPCPPAHNRGITHPHVQSDLLCEGDGRHAIARALEDGRLGEFFLLVAQILRTYNPDSAYHVLSSWNGSPCDDCGDLVDDDSMSSCDRCDCRLCDGCSRCCPHCDHVICAECCTACASCGGRMCDDCCNRCEKCESSCCRDCLKNNLCPDCLTPSGENDDAEPEDSPDASPPAAEAPPQTPAAKAGVPLQPVCVGQTAVSA